MSMVTVTETGQPASQPATPPNTHCNSHTTLNTHTHNTHAQVTSEGSTWLLRYVGHNSTEVSLREGTAVVKKVLSVLAHHIL